MLSDKAASGAVLTRPTPQAPRPTRTATVPDLVRHTSRPRQPRGALWATPLPPFTSTVANSRSASPIWGYHCSAARRKGTSRGSGGSSSGLQPPSAGSMRANNGVSGHARNGAMATLAILGAGSGRAQNTPRLERYRAPTGEREPAVLLRADRCAVPQTNKDGAPGEDKEGTSPLVLSDLPA